MEFQLKDHTYVELKNLLKLLNLVNSGGEARHFIRSGEVMVNGEVDTRPGKKLREGDMVIFHDQEVHIKL